MRKILTTVLALCAALVLNAQNVSDLIISEALEHIFEFFVHEDQIRISQIFERAHECVDTFFVVWHNTLLKELVNKI